MDTSVGGEENKIVELKRTHITQDKTCSNCNFDLSKVIDQVKTDSEINSDQPLFCPHCGFSFGEYKETILICKKCKVTLPKDEIAQMNYCHNCGRKFLRKPEEVSEQKKQASNPQQLHESNQQG